MKSFFQTGSSSPEEVVQFLEAMKSFDGPVDEFAWLSSLNVNRLTVDGVAVRFEKSNGARNRIALLTLDTKGLWEIDFDAFARTVKPAWHDFFEKPFESAVVRVFFVKDNYSDGPFRDEKEWMCLTLRSPDKEEVLFGYCKTGAPQAAAPLQFEISRVLAEDWILTGVPYDEGFR